MCFIAIFGKIFRLYLSVLLLVECISFIVFLNIVPSREVSADSCFLCDKAAVLGETAKQRAEFSQDAEE
jgi:hypothetical protein